ncbi:MAG: ABC transporter ATP-binding protein [Mycobacterium sp.]|uniref:ABC transporter ATP-binding protein n=1 Tax=Mycobacterium sp. TaxID=1785 RepID=UPI00389A500B
MTAIRVKDLLHRYGTGSAAMTSVDHVSFDVGDGEFYTLLGPSGCGKSTTLRCIAGLEDPSGGVIELDGAVVVSGRAVVPPNKRDIGLVFQDYAVWPHMTVFENVAYPLRISRKVTRSEIRSRVQDALHLVGLEQFIDRRATQLSGGQQQRLSLARALVRQPKVLLLDEPLSNLDAKLREQMRTELRSIQRRLKIATLFVTHDQVEALSMSNRIAVMRDGKIVQEGTPREVYLKPNCEFVARFVGSATFIRGTVAAYSSLQNEATLTTSMGPLRARTLDAVKVHDTVEVVVRPEAVLLDDATTAVNCFEGEIALAHFVGDAVDYSVRVGDESIRVKGGGRTNLRRGTRVHITLPVSECTVLRDEVERPVGAITDIAPSHQGNSLEVAQPSTNR